MRGPAHASVIAPRALGRQGRHRQRRRHRAQAGVVSAPRARGRRATRVARHFRGVITRRRRAVRAAEPQRAELPAPRRARRRRHALAQDGRAGQGLLDRDAAHGDRRARRAGPRGSPGMTGGGPARSESALDAGVLTLTLDRPDKRNALSAELMEALHAAARRADLDADVRVVLAPRRGTRLLRRRRPRRASCLCGSYARRQRGGGASTRGRCSPACARLPKPVWRSCRVARSPAAQGWRRPATSPLPAPAPRSAIRRSSVGSSRHGDDPASPRGREKQALDLGPTGRVLPPRRRWRRD